MKMVVDTLLDWLFVEVEVRFVSIVFFIWLSYIFGKRRMKKAWSRRESALARENIAGHIFMLAVSDVVPEKYSSDVCERANEIADEYDIPFGDMEFDYEYGDVPKEAIDESDDSDDDDDDWDYSVDDV